MSINEGVKTALLKGADHVKCKTGYSYYDLSYPTLLKAGQQLMLDASNQDAAVTIAGGLLGWNQGSKHVGKLSRFVDSVSEEGSTTPSALASLVNSLNEINNDEIDLRESNKIIDGFVCKAQKVLDMKSVVMPSKLLHFLSPTLFAITDRRINASVGGGVNNNKHSYIEYIQCIWELGFHLNKPTDDSFSSYWRFGTSASPLRTADCTLFAINGNLILNR